MHSKSAFLLISMSIEYFLCELVRVYALLYYAEQTSDTFLPLMVPTVLLIGPVFFGIAAGVLTVNIRRSNLAHPIILLSLFATASFISIPVLSHYTTWFLLTVVAILSYLSANIRIAVSKTAVPPDEYSRFHSGVVLILQVGPIISPIIAVGIISGFINANFASVSFAILMASGAILFYYIIKKLYPHSRHEPAREINFHTFIYSFKDATQVVFRDAALRSSVVVASLQNVLVFVSGSLASVQYQRASSSFELGGLPLFLAGCGAMAGAALAGSLKKKSPSGSLLVACLLASVALVVAQAMNVSDFVTLAAVFLIGAAGAITAVCAWDIRLQKSSRENIGSVAGLTGALYKLPSIAILPLVGLIGNMSGNSVALLSTVVIVCGLFCCSAIVEKFFVRPLSKTTT